MDGVTDIDGVIDGVGVGVGVAQIPTCDIVPPVSVTNTVEPVEIFKKVFSGIALPPYSTQLSVPNTAVLNKNSLMEKAFIGVAADKQTSFIDCPVSIL